MGSSAITGSCHNRYVTTGTMSQESYKLFSGVTPETIALFGETTGETDEFGFGPIEKPVPVRDLHATILNQLGLDHERLTFKYAGRNFRLTDVAGTVVKDVLA